MTILLDNVDVDVESAEYLSRGGPALLIIRGDNFGGGTVKLVIASVADVNSASNTGERWATFNSISTTSSDNSIITFIPVGTRIKATLTGSTSPVDVYVEIIQ